MYFPEHHYESTVDSSVDSFCGVYRPEQAIVMQKEVLSADQWEHFMENSLGRTNSGWLSTLFNSQKSVPVLSDSAERQLHYILSTAPTWDRSVVFVISFSHLSSFFTLSFVRIRQIFFSCRNPCLP